MSAEVQAPQRRRPPLGILVPAKDEDGTIAGVIAAAAPVAALFGGQVVVVADHCSDRTVEVASRAGAVVFERETDSPSKATAVSLGIAVLDAEVVCLLDADCVDLSSAGVLQIVMPVLRKEATMSVASFDYGPWSWLVESLPWSTGQRAFPSDLYPIGDDRLESYNVELLLNEAVGRVGGTTFSRTLPGLRHRSKVAKTGLLDGVRANFRMWRSIASVLDRVDKKAYERYARNVVIDFGGTRRRPAAPLVVAGVRLMSTVGRALHRVP